MQQTDEQRLITRILNGHTEDYSYFMERYGENVFRLVARLVTTQEDAEELVQDAFVRAYNHLLYRRSIVFNMDLPHSL